LHHVFGLLYIINLSIPQFLAETMTIARIAGAESSLALAIPPMPLH